MNLHCFIKILPSDDFETKIDKFLYSNNKMHKTTEMSKIYILDMLCNCNPVMKAMETPLDTIT